MTSQSIEVVRGRLEGERAEEVLSFWSGRGALEGDAAHERLAQVVCLLLDGNEIAGVNSAFEARVPLLGNRNFWVYRMLVAPEVEPQARASMVAAAYDELAREFVDGSGPIGVCMQIDDPSKFPHDREAFWPDIGMLYAGYLPDGRQLRIRYFEGARI